MTNGVDPALNAAELPTGDPVPNRTPSHAKLHELPAANQTVLRLGKVPNGTVKQTGGTFCMPDMQNVRFARHPADGRRVRRARGARKATKAQRK
jgi:hypothetical protein